MTENQSCHAQACLSNKIWKFNVYCLLRQSQSRKVSNVLGFHLKANDYEKEGWRWLVAKVEKIINHWSLKWLSRAGRLMMIKSALEAISVYWTTMTCAPKGILRTIRRICGIFLWAGNKEESTLPWVASENIALSKACGG